MKRNFICPICECNDWKDIEKYRFREDRESPRKSLLYTRLEAYKDIIRRFTYWRSSNYVFEKRHLNAHQKLRKKVFLNVWNGPETLTSIMCKKCGFVCYTPRPEKEDIDNKYAFLSQHSLADDDVGAGRAVIAKVAAERSQKIFEILSKHKTHNSGRVLDFGGGDGKLLSTFLDSGHICSLVDYSNNQLPGVNKIGNTEEDLVGEFDYVILSHVLEHVSEPLQLIKKLGAHMTNDGLIYVEIPIEIVAGLNLHHDPITHINFFTLSTLISTLQAGGFSVLEAFQGRGSYATALKEVAWVVAKPGHSEVQFNPAETVSQLQPSVSERLKMLWKFKRRNVRQ